MMDEYKTISGISETNLIVKKSRFIGLGTSISSTEEIKDFLDYAKTEYPKASHYCYAYSIGFDENKREYSSDAGEPTNSAGPPILAAVSSSELNNVICVVIRWWSNSRLRQMRQRVPQISYNRNPNFSSNLLSSLTVSAYRLSIESIE